MYSYGGYSPANGGSGGRRPGTGGGVDEDKVAQAVDRLREIESQVQEVLALIAPSMDAGQDDLVHKREAAKKMEDQYAYEPGKSMDPLSMSRIAWDVFIGFMVFLDLMIVPYDAAFLGRSNSVWLWFTAAIFSFDILVCCNTGYYEGGRLVKNQGKAFRRYAHTLLWADMFALIPWGPMLRQFRWVEGDATVLLTARLIRAFKLQSILSSLSALWILMGGTGSAAIRARAHIVLQPLLLTHLVACAVGLTIHDEEDAWGPNVKPDLHYVTSLQWAMALLTGNGVNGDIIVTEEYSRMVHYLAMLCGFYIGVVLLSNLVDARTRLAICRSAEDSKYDKFTAFLGSLQCPVIVKKQLQQSAKGQIERDRGTAQTARWLSGKEFSFPPDLSMGLDLYVRRGSILKHPEFQGWVDEESQKKLDQVLDHTSFRVFSNGSKVVFPGKRCTELMIPVQGQLVLLDDPSHARSSNREDDHEQGSRLEFVGGECLKEDGSGDDIAYNGTVIAEGHLELLCVPGTVVRQHRPRNLGRAVETGAGRVKIPMQRAKREEVVHEPPPQAPMTHGAGLGFGSGGVHFAADDAFDAGGWDLPRERGQSRFSSDQLHMSLLDETEPSTVGIMPGDVELHDNVSINSPHEQNKYNDNDDGGEDRDTSTEDDVSLVNQRQPPYYQR
jgi:hypothetical protein